MQELVAPPENVARAKLRAHLQTAACALTVSIGYYAATKVGFALTVPNYAVSALWPANALVLAALLLTPKRIWPVLVLAVFPAHIAVQFGSGVPLPMLLLWFVSNSVEALVGAFLIRRYTDGVPQFDRSRHVAIFLVCSTATVIATSFLDTGFVALVGWGTKGYWEVFRMRCFSNLLAVMTVVPTIVSTATLRASSRRSMTGWRSAELGVLAIGLVVVNLLPFLAVNNQVAFIPVLVYAPLPFLLWASLRFGPVVVSWSLLVTALLVIQGAMHGVGPFTTMSPAENVLSLQAFLFTMTVPLVLLAAFVRELHATADALRSSQERLARTESFSSVMLTHVGLDGRWLRVPPTLCELLGYTEAQLLERTVDYVTHPEDLESTQRNYERLLCGRIQTFSLEKRYIRSDGCVLWVDINSSLVTEAEGRPLHFLTYVKDITDRKGAEAALRESHEQVRELAARLISAQEEERQRIARDLHDDLNQQVAVVAIGLSVLKRRLSSSPGPFHDSVLGLQTRVGEIADRIRAMSHDLHSSTLEHVGLSAALTSLCNEFRRLQVMSVQFDANGELEALPAETELCLYRVAQESLRNAAEHSGAGQAEVVLTGNGESVRLVVRDNGVGFDYAAARKTGGIGLVSMEERVRSLGGTLRITARPGHGSEIVAEIPVEKVSYVESTGAPG